MKADTDPDYVSFPLTEIDVDMARGCLYNKTCAEKCTKIGYAVVVELADTYV